VKRKVLFLCTGNSCRSQIAEGLLNHLYPNRYQAFSAGVNPATVHPKAIAVMDEIGIDISRQISKPIDGFLNRRFDMIITLCDHAKEVCPIFPGCPVQIHWNIEDPADATGSPEEVMGVFRAVRETIRKKIENELV